MIQLRLVLFGVTVVASLGYAIYRHYTERSQQQQHSYGPRSDNSSPPNNEYTVPSTSISSGSDETRKRRKTPNKLEKTPISSNCSICLVDLSSSAKNSMTLNCGHLFHDNCIGAWFNSNQKTCPNCRAWVS